MHIISSNVYLLNPGRATLLICVLCAADGEVASSAADISTVSPQLQRWVETIHQHRAHLTQLWHARKLKLEQCFQLRLFEQDVEKVIATFAPL